MTEAIILGTEVAISIVNAMVFLSINALLKRAEKIAEKLPGP